MSKNTKAILIVGGVVLGMLLLCGGAFAVLAAIGTSPALSTPATAQQEPQEPPQEHTPGIGDPAKPAATQMGDGTWAVGAEIKAGTYTTVVPGGDFALCLWQRLSGFSGNPNEAIEIGTGEEGRKMRVTISSKDVGFSSDGCGTWKRTGS